MHEASGNNFDEIANQGKNVMQNDDEQYEGGLREAPEVRAIQKRCIWKYQRATQKQ